MIANKKSIAALEGGISRDSGSEMQADKVERKDSVEVLEEQQQHGGLGGVAIGWMVGVTFLVGLITVGTWAAVEGRRGSTGFRRSRSNDRKQNEEDADAHLSMGNGDKLGCHTSFLGDSFLLTCSYDPDSRHPSEPWFYDPMDHVFYNQYDTVPASASGCTLCKASSAYGGVRCQFSFPRLSLSTVRVKRCARRGQGLYGGVYPEYRYDLP